MDSIHRITGGIALEGKVFPIPNKNSLMGALPLSVLAKGGVSYVDLPSTTDVEGFLEIFQRLGAKIKLDSHGVTLINCDQLSSCTVDADIGREFRGAFSLVGPLLARYGEASVPVPGGCKLGTRSLSVHINAFRELGIMVKEENDMLSFSLPKQLCRKATVWLLEASVTTTLNIAMFAAAMDMEVEIIDAACEPHVCDILHALSEMGAQVDGIGTNKIRIAGRPTLGPCRFRASPDFVDIAGYCVAAAMTGGKIIIEGANVPAIVDGILKWFRLFNVNIEKSGKDLVVKGNQPLRVNILEFPLAGRDLPKFVVRPWPGFPVDVLPVMVTLATKAEGRVLFQNWMYESGFDFVRELGYMGAEIYMSDPQRIIVMEPPAIYKGGMVGAPGVIQGTKAIFLAALADKVTTVIHGTGILRRRYPNIFETYRNLGAQIEAMD